MNGLPRRDVHRRYVRAGGHELPGMRKETHMMRALHRLLSGQPRELTTAQWKDKLLAEARTQHERDDILAMFDRFEREEAAAVRAAA